MDEFDSITFADEGETTRGYRDGVSHGVKVGIVEGFSMGMSRGRDVAEEIAFYYGFCQIFKMKVQALSQRNVDKICAKLSRMVDLLQNIMEMSAENKSFSDCLEEIRKHFRILASRLNVDVSYTKQNDGMSY